MQNIFYEVQSLDKRCYEVFGLSEDLLMENAASALAFEIAKVAKEQSKILFLCGTGNNGADGIAAARMLTGAFDVSIYLTDEPKSQMAKLQIKRAQFLHVKIVQTLEEADIYVDCIFGSGLKKEMPKSIVSLLEHINDQEGFKIACDIPSGIEANGNITHNAFRADVSVTMGALKEALFSDGAKDFVGEIKIANLGLSQKNYEIQSDTYLLQESDLCLPNRAKKSVHKGNFGHANIICGQKEGASILCSMAAFNFGAGLVSVTCEKECNNLPPYIMQSKQIASNANVLVMGMGLGAIKKEKISKYLLEIPKAVLDADMFYEKSMKEILNFKKELVLTPHPKEFCALLKILKLADVSVEMLQKDRFHYVRIFAKAYPQVVLLLKGANTIITCKEKLYVNPLGSAKLAKGGSGDVLAGMIGALIAQGYSCLDAAINASIAHALAAKATKFADYALSPLDICEEIKWLQKR